MRDRRDGKQEKAKEGREKKKGRREGKGKGEKKGRKRKKGRKGKKRRKSSYHCFPPLRGASQVREMAQHIVSLTAKFST
ncbi:hypothetical protein, partial [Escherichia coli]|uniref:hypothetical protein n=1 Tax=Escherichia coli TaxID=562 RepID=UPI001BAF8875